MNPTYPALEKYTYLNTPEQGLMSQELHNYRQELNDNIMMKPTFIMNERTDFIEGVRRKTAAFLHSDHKLTALIPNFSFGFNALLEGISRDYKFLLIEGDYPSLNWPVEARDFNRCYAKLDAHLEDNIAAVVVKHQPQVLCLSIVQYISGIKINLDFLKDLKKKFPDLIIIADATQYVGVESFRFRESGIDILAASCYKWMHAGNGNGFICFKEEVVDRIKPKFTSFNSKVGFKNERGSFMGHFEPGHQDLVSFGSLVKAVEIIDSLGLKSIEERINLISDTAQKEFQERNLLSKMVNSREHHSQIFNLKGDETLYDRLIKNNVLCSQRGDGIRIGFTYYNTKADLKKLLNIIDDWR